MADDDNFDIDIYGDDSAQDYNDGMNNNTDMAQDHSTAETLAGDTYETGHDASDTIVQDAHEAARQEDVVLTEAPDESENQRQQISSTGGSAHDQVQVPKQAPVQQGVKRKEGPDDRPTDPGATAALQIQDLHWWVCEDDIRGWANQAGCEDELKDVTFNEHKVNGKSKGQVFIEMTSAQAATALKHRVESFGSSQPHGKKYAITYHISELNPFRTHPKEVPNRKDRDNGRANSNSYNNNQGGNYNQNMSHGGYGGMQNFRGRGGYNQNRGGGMGYNNQRNFSNPANMNMSGGGFGGGPMGGGFGGNMGGGMNMGMSGMNQFNNFNRGGMMGGMRGGMQNNRGRGGNMMGGMGMGMGGMGAMGGMGMNGMMGGGMAGGFGQTAPHFNPAFFNQGGQQSGDWSSQHPAKRQRAE